MKKIYPFKFLDSYQMKDKDFFFGRDDEIDSLYQMIFQSRILLIYGTSGTGKTSLIQCGLANKFQTYDWLALFIRRGSNLISSLDKTLCLEGDDAFTYVEDKNPVIKNITEKIAAVYKASFKPIYLIFDQFEELYVLGSKSEQQNFIKVVKDILAVEQPIKIIISIREEYLGFLYEFEREVPELLRKKLRVEPMNFDKVKTVITNIGLSPKSNVHLKTGEEEQIAKSIFEKIRGDEKTLSIQLPYLQVFLDTLYMQMTHDDTQKTEATFTLAELKKIGNIGDVLRNFLDEQVAITSKNLKLKQDTIWKFLSPFVTLEGTKEPLSSEQLIKRFPDEPITTVNSFLDAFVKNRILRYTEKEQLYEIAHDSLAKQVNAKRSDEEIAILEVQRLIKSQVAVNKDAREYFTERQLLFIEPFLEKFKGSDEELDWIAKSRIYRKEEQKNQQDQLSKLKEAKATKKRLQNMISLLIIASVAIVAIVYLWIDADLQKKKLIKQKAKTEIALDDLKKYSESLQLLIDSASGREKEKLIQIQNQKKSLIVGSLYQGGIIFSLDKSGDHGLIVAKNDQNDGKVTEWDNAKEICDSLELEGFTGWRLPTINELEIIYKEKINISNLDVDKLYWSSTSAGGSYVRLINFGHGATNYKYNTAQGHKYLVRAVRKF